MTNQKFQCIKIGVCERRKPELRMRMGEHSALKHYCPWESRWNYDPVGTRLHPKLTKVGSSGFHMVLDLEA